MSIAGDIKADSEAAIEAQRLWNVYLVEYQAACGRFDWAEAEVVRGKLMGAVDAYLDHLGAMYKRVQSEV